MWRSYRVPKTGQIIKKSSTYQMVMANSVALSSRVWMNPFSLKMLATRHTRDGFDILNPKTGQRTKADLDTLMLLPNVPDFCTSHRDVAKVHQIITAGCTFLEKEKNK